MGWILCIIHSAYLIGEVSFISPCRNGEDEGSGGTGSKAVHLIAVILQGIINSVKSFGICFPFCKSSFDCLFTIFADSNLYFIFIDKAVGYLRCNYNIFFGVINLAVRLWTICFCDAVIAQFWCAGIYNKRNRTIFCIVFRIVCCFYLICKFVFYNFFCIFGMKGKLDCSERSIWLRIHGCLIYLYRIRRISLLSVKPLLQRLFNFFPFFCQHNRNFFVVNETLCYFRCNCYILTAVVNQITLCSSCKKFLTGSCCNLVITHFRIMCINYKVDCIIACFIFGIIFCHYLIRKLTLYCICLNSDRNGSRRFTRFWIYLLLIYFYLIRIFFCLIIQPLLQRFCNCLVIFLQRQFDFFVVDETLCYIGFNRYILAAVVN